MGTAVSKSESQPLRRKRVSYAFEADPCSCGGSFRNPHMVK